MPEHMEEDDYLRMNTACEFKEKGTREKNDWNEVSKEGTSPLLDLDPNQIITADGKSLPYAEEDWEKPRTIRGSHQLGTKSTVFDADKTT